MADSTKLLLLGGAGAAVWWFYLRNPVAAAAPAASTPGASPVVPAAPAVPKPALAAIQAKVLADVNPPRWGVPIDTWNYSLGTALQAAGLGPAPDPMPFVLAVMPDYTRDLPVTPAQWAIISTNMLQAAPFGLSGFGDLNCPGDPGCPGYVAPGSMDYQNSLLQEILANQSGGYASPIGPAPATGGLSTSTLAIGAAAVLVLALGARR